MCMEDANECAEGTANCPRERVCIDHLGGFTCECRVGVTGTKCDEDVNECDGKSVCNNGGTCVNIYGSFVCRCKTFYTGKYCETEVERALGTPNCRDYMSLVCRREKVCFSVLFGTVCKCSPELSEIECKEHVSSIKPIRNVRGGD